MNAVNAVCSLLLSQAILLQVSAQETSRPAPDVCLTSIRCTREFCQAVRDRNGCYYCACPTNTCANVRCSAGYECVMVQRKQCFTTPCFPDPKCVPVTTTTEKPTPEDCLTDIRCTGEFCEPVKDRNGCYYCACPTSTCANVECSAGYECVMKQTKQCFTTPCFPDPVCEPVTVAPPTCPPVLCDIWCENGNVKDENGCDTCTCQETTPQTACPPVCEIWCEHGNVKDENGCDTCRCQTAPPETTTTEKPTPDDCLTEIECTGEFCQPVRDSRGCYYCACPNKTCANVLCIRGTRCVMKQLRQCVSAPCFPTPVCEPIQECPMIKCLSTCRPGVGPDGCPICNCSQTCEDSECADDERCIMDKVICKKEPCDPQPKCVPKECPMIKCLSTCRPGVGPDGCPICNCPKTCEDTKCADNETCIMLKVICKEEPCDPQPKCVPKDTDTCTTAVCKLPCVADIGPDGCNSVCACPSTCDNIKCRMDEACELEEVTCVRAPCFPIPTCRPKNKTCYERPNRDRCGRLNLQWTYNSTANACQVFFYYGCTPSPNTFSDQKQCSATCVTPTKACPRLMCAANCYYVKKTPDSCPECFCPCETIECREGFECKLRRDDECTEEPCDPKAYCAPIA